MLTIGDISPVFSLKAVKGGNQGLNLNTEFIDVMSGWMLEGGR